MPVTAALYSGNPEWVDVEPLPVDDGGPNALAVIAYTDEYKEAISYLRAVMAVNEFSPRVLKLTAHVIRLNPAHYTVWLYRAKTLEVLQLPIPEELEWLNDIALRHIKNYQIWHHRQTLITRLKAQLEAQQEPFNPASEMEFLNQMFEKDAKNYHVWSYRQWLIKIFNLWDSEAELNDIERWLREDVMNNSAWNHRWYLCFGPGISDKTWTPSAALAEREIEFAKNAISLEPRNESPWNYLHGVIAKSGRPLAELEPFVRQFVPSLVDNKDIRSEFALSTLAQIYEGQGKPVEAAEIYDILGKKIDQIRHNYWAYRKSCVEVSPTPATAENNAAGVEAGA